MAEPVFVKVVGFSDVERHALNTLFRLSAGQAVHYMLWAEDAPAPAALALVDGESYEARLSLETTGVDPAVKLIWVGPQPPAQAWRSFERPLHWPHVVQAMDSLYGPPAELDFDLGFDAGPDTQPPEPDASGRRALVVNTSAEERLYLRARLALAGLVFTDEAATAADALALVQAQPYTLVLLDLALPDRDGWQLLRELRAAPTAPGAVWVTTAASPLLAPLRARRAGAQACLAKPFDPAQLHELLQKL